MKSLKRGRIVSKGVEVQNISSHGIWLVVSGEEFFLPYQKYPWFRYATIDQVCDLEMIGRDIGIHWPQLDVDIEIDSLRHPELYPLKARVKR